MIARKRLERRERRLVRVFLFLIALPFLAIFPYFAATNNPNENTRTFMTMALVDFGTFQLDEIVARQGWTNDMARVKGKDGVHHNYSVKGPANGYMGVVPYWAFTKVAPLVGIEKPSTTSSVETRLHWLRMSTWVIRLFSVSLPCFLFLAWLERYLRDFSRDPVLRLSAVAAAGIGTNYLGYALMNVSHALFGVSSFLAFALTERELRVHADARARRFAIAFAVGLCAGWTTMLEYHGLPLSVVLTLFACAVFWRPTRLFGVALGGAVTIALTAWFQYKQYGNPLTPGHLFVENPIWAEEHKRGIFGMIMPSKESVFGLSLPTGSGFFGMSPYMWLAFLALPFAVVPTFSSLRAKIARRKSVFVLFVAMFALWFAACGAIEWRAGWTLGPRRLGAAPPFFAFASLCALEWLAQKSKSTRAMLQGIAVGLTLVGVVSVGLVGIVYNTLPESALRPFAYFALPAIQGGFVPHHIAEWFGWKTTTFWYIVAGGMLLAPLLVLFHRSCGEGRRAMIGRLSFATVAFAAGMYPAMTPPPLDEIGDHKPNISAWARGWEPAGRDRVTLMREEAERYGPRRSCPWYRLADLERMLHLEAEAAEHERRASGPRENCPKLLF
ncbi:MAG: hypothetical protein KF819_33280 [Labilithrix sp.]|nr:hypothetical protein [Labilithrix sp.]